MAPGGAPSATERFGPPSGVRQADLGLGLLLVNLQHGDYVVLDATARAMWQAFLGPGATRAQAVAHLLAQFEVEPDLLAQDLERFLTQARRAGLLAPLGGHNRPTRPTRAAEPTRQRAHRQPPLQARSALGLTWHAWWMLWRTARAVAKGSPGWDGPDTAQPSPAAALAGDVNGLPLRQALAAFRRAECFYVSRRAPDDCLPRSLALHRFLRDAGLPATHCIGFDRGGTGAHAWVECQGDVVLDRDRRAQMVRLVPVTP